MNCPQCGNTYAPGNRFCGNCGYNLVQSDATQTGPVGPSPTETSTPFEPPTSPVESPASTVVPPPVDLICPRCHRANDADSAFCYACGFPLTEVREDQRSGDPLPAFGIGAPGSFWFRTAAYIIDSLVIVLPLVFLWIILGQPVPENFDQIINPPEGYDRLQVLVLFLTMAYDTALITYFATTVGKRAFGLYVVRTDGSRVGFVRALARHILTALSANLTLGFIFLVVLFRKDRRGVHDLLCDTVVIRRYRQRTHPDPGVQ